MENFHIRWSNYKRSKIYVIGLLVYENKWYFQYNHDQIEEAIKEGFRPFPEMNDINKIYESDQLFSTFGNRYPENNQPLSLMKNSEGTLFTDKVLIKYIEKKQERVR